MGSCNYAVVHTITCLGGAERWIVFGSTCDMCWCGHKNKKKDIGGWGWEGGTIGSKRIHSPSSLSVQVYTGYVCIIQSYHVLQKS